ncbi:MAG: bifunctional serine/threonine-protein kinase/formylglycine-generating enzyme family protein [Planctomycetota bacterium]
MTAGDGRPLEDLPADIEELAGEILFGPVDLRQERFESLCAAHERWRPQLSKLRSDFERAARVLVDLEPSSKPVLPQAIGPYRILREVGEGAFGVVFLAEQEEPFRRQVAVKLLHHAAASPSAVARFLNEREVLSRMSHPAIAMIFDGGLDAHGRPWLAMEYVPGEALNRHVQTRGLDLLARIDLFLAACEGVHHAHQRGVIHRDLKPQNILVAEVDGVAQPKVIDFGLAKVFGDHELHTMRTHAGAVLGTPAYMSPEQMRGDAQSADIRTDVYALGVILYELLTGTLPIGADSLRRLQLAELQRLITEVEPPLASRRALQAQCAWSRSLRGDLDWILCKAMSKRADDRYGSVAEFAADLRRHLAHEPVLAGPPSTGYLLLKFVRRHRGAVIAAGLLLASLLAGLAVSAALYREANANAAAAAARLSDFWRLADTVELEELIATAGSLWPSSPARLADHERWLQRAEGLCSRRDEHAAALRSLAAESSADYATDSERRGARFLVDRLQKHLANLESFSAPDGLRDQIRERTRFARQVEALTITEHAADWSRVIEAVAHGDHYEIVDMKPIRGLVPLGPDPDSGLEEFAHPQSGRVPVRGPDGRLRIDDDTAIVLVLIPGGHRLIGSQQGDPKQPHFDPYRQKFEGEPKQISGAPFLLGKYELTQQQVKTLHIAVQALHRMGTEEMPGLRITGRHPEESVLWPQVIEWLPRFELRLPSSAEWEVAARAGTSGIWGAGERIADLQGFANIADATLREAGVDIAADAEVRDGFAAHAPVGSLRPNGYGLFDMLGNVAEMTVTRSGDAETVILARGGSFMLTAVDCRIGSMRLVAPNQSSAELGVRVARSLAE